LTSIKQHPLTSIKQHHLTSIKQHHDFFPTKWVYFSEFNTNSAIFQLYHGENKLIFALF
jgi:hypothetical protein